MKRTLNILFVLVITSVLLSACGGSGNAEAQAVESYLKAVVAKNADQAVTLSCAAWEENARLEVDAFNTVSPELEGMACKLNKSEGESAQVACSGKILATYDAEKQEFSLEGKSYNVVKEGGEWRMCGYK